MIQKWAQDNLDIAISREHEAFLEDNSKIKLLCVPRRAGKTTLICVDALYKCLGESREPGPPSPDVVFNLLDDDCVPYREPRDLSSPPRIVIASMRVNMREHLWSVLKAIIDNNPDILSELVVFMPLRIEFKNGSIIYGVDQVGGISPTGISPDYLYIDNTELLSEECRSRYNVLAFHSKYVIQTMSSNE